MTLLQQLFLLCLISLVNSLRCFTTTCPGNHSACIELCPSGSAACHALRFTNNGQHQTVDLSCTPAHCDPSATCDFAPINIPTGPHINLTSCCCTEDYCNRANGVTDIVDPVLGLATDMPTVSAPDRPSDVLICEKYNCSLSGGGPCYHGYEVCSETIFGTYTTHGNYSCSSSYGIHSVTQKLELRYKGCIYEASIKQYDTFCNQLTNCHVDNPLVHDPNNNYYFCCCGESLCNQNDTFTHPTEVSVYGLDACIDKGCSHSCLISNNVASCYCQEGYVLVNGTECLDMDECKIDNGGCDEICVNTDGSFLCECGPGKVLDPIMNVCISNDGIFCLNRFCRNFNISECTAERDESCTFSSTMITDPNMQHCQAVYIYFHDGSGLFPRTQSCFNGGHTCSDKCEMKVTHNDSYGIYFYCCCNEDFCNLEDRLIFPNLTSLPITTSEITVSATESSFSSPVSAAIAPSSSPLIIDYTQPAIIVSFFIFGVILCIIFITGVIFVHYKTKRRNIPIEIDHRTPSPIFSIEPHILNTIGQGRFAKVCKAKRADEEVAIKIFNNTLQAKDSWNHEKDIYMTEKLEHENILKFIDHEHHVEHGRITYWLIFDYHPFGSLYEYLQTHSLSLMDLCSLSTSAAKGLAHLHFEGSSNGPISKPAIAHRDLKSKNILVKQNLTCCISDFGLAIKLKPDEQHKAKGQVGTSRYMAPEVLEGAISFDQESFLRIDVYAFGLILWEMSSRCELSNNQVSEYRPPFDGLVSPNPSINEMKQVVATEKKRPEIPPGFYISQDYNRIVETISECWDSDFEARPPSSLISSRLEEFQDRMIDSPKNLMNMQSKESGFLSHQSLGIPRSESDTYNTPLPPTPTPSYSPSITMSPTDVKPHRPSFNLVGSYPIYPASSSFGTSPQAISRDDACDNFYHQRPSNRPTAIVLSSSAYSTSSPIVSPQHGICNTSIENSVGSAKTISLKSAPTAKVYNETSL